MRDSKAWTIIGLLWGTMAAQLAIIVILVLMLVGCSSPTEPKFDCMYYPEYGKWIGEDCETSSTTVDTELENTLFATGMNTPLAIDQQKGPPRFVCNNSEHPPPWCDDNNWTEDLPPGQQP